MAREEIGGLPAVTIKIEKEDEKETRHAEIKVTPTSKDKSDIANKRGCKISELTKHRTNIKEVILWSNATPIRRYGGKGYMCCYCDSHFLEPGDLKNHTLVNHHDDIRQASFMTSGGLDQFVIRLDITSLRCKICKQNIETLSQLIEHLIIKHDKNIYTDINNHIIPFKFHSETLQCCICTNTFTKFKALSEHMNLHFRNFICDVCNSGYVYYQSLKNHKLIHETGKFHCEFCPKMFNTNIKRKSHERLTHSLKPVYRCDYCNETFNYYRKKEAHLVTMHGLKLPTPKCEACGKVFKMRVLLSQHIKRDHLMDRRHKCSECDMSFFLTTELKEHMVKHTGEKSFKCTVCMKPFPRAKSLKEHMKIHDDVRRFKCEHCGQAFVQKCSWKRHMMSKHEEIV